MTTTTPKYMAVQAAALLVAGGFLVIGVLGFIPGATTDYDLLEWSGHHSGAKLFGIFAISGLHNILHLVSGGVGVASVRLVVVLVAQTDRTIKASLSVDKGCSAG